MHPKVLAAFEEIDADIFNGDSIANNRELAQIYIERWLKRMPALVGRPRSREENRTCTLCSGTGTIDADQLSVHCPACQPCVPYSDYDQDLEEAFRAGHAAARSQDPPWSPAKVAEAVAVWRAEMTSKKDDDHGR